MAVASLAACVFSPALTASESPSVAEPTPPAVVEPAPPEKMVPSIERVQQLVMIEEKGMRATGSMRVCGGAGEFPGATANAHGTGGAHPFLLNHDELLHAFY